MIKTKQDIADKFRDIRKLLNDLVDMCKHMYMREYDYRDITDLNKMVDRKLEWILNILIIWFDLK